MTFIRTALYFSIAGLSVNRLLNIRYVWWVELAFWITAFFILTTGIFKYRKQRKSIKDSEKHIGHYKLQGEAES